MHWRRADVAIASTGTVTMECAFFAVPTVTLYKTSWSTYQIGKRIVTVKWLTMPNLLANQEIFPEFVQNAATPRTSPRAPRWSLFTDETRRQAHQDKATGPGRRFAGQARRNRARSNGDFEFV